MRETYVADQHVEVLFCFFNLRDVNAVFLFVLTANTRCVQGFSSLLATVQHSDAAVYML